MIYVVTNEMLSLQKVMQFKQKVGNRCLCFIVIAC